MEDVTDARRAEYQQRFLAAASKLVSSSLDVEATFERAAWATVPEIADWCCIDVPDERGRVTRHALAAEPARHAELDALRAAVDLHRDGPDQPGALLRDARARLFRSVDDALLRAWAVDDAGFERLRAAGLRSVIAVPLMAGEQPIGLMTMGTDASARVLGDAELGRELAGQARKMVEQRFSWEGVAEQTRRFYDRLLAGDRPTPRRPELGGVR
jgi:GAF domain-containing protein